MNITVAKIKRELSENHGWDKIESFDDPLTSELISDVLKVINDILITQKGISIKK